MSLTLIRNRIVGGRKLAQFALAIATFYMFATRTHARTNSHNENGDLH